MPCVSSKDCGKYLGVPLRICLTILFQIVLRILIGSIDHGDW